MPALPSELLVLLRRETAAQARNTDGGRIQISGTALGFLIPLFALFILGPISLVFFVRHRRTRRAGLVAPNQRPVRGGLRARGLLTGRPIKTSRETARRELEGVTEVIRFGEEGGMEEKKVQWKREMVMREEVEKLEGMGGAVGREDEGDMVEEECAICLSTLYAPSPPEPAKLRTAAPVRAAHETVAVEDPDDASVSAASLSVSEEILRLNVCHHEFHAECLASWFAFSKFSCPICRAVYYGSGKAECIAEAESAATQGEGRRSSRREEA